MLDKSTRETFEFLLLFGQKGPKYYQNGSNKSTPTFHTQSTWLFFWPKILKATFCASSKSLVSLLHFMTSTYLKDGFSSHKIPFKPHANFCLSTTEFSFVNVLNFPMLQGPLYVKNYSHGPQTRCDSIVVHGHCFVLYYNVNVKE